MAYAVRLPPALAGQWAIKIRDRERVEPPHCTILKGTRAWRVDLRSGKFMDAEPDPREVPNAVLAALKSHWDELCARWDEMYPGNPVAGEEPSDE
jgi:hypothetical protein